MNYANAVLFLPLQPPTQATAQPVTTHVCTHAIAWSSLSTERFNLFVLENEEYSNGVFSIAKTKAIQNYTHEIDIEQFRFLDAAAISELKQMPCIFAKRNAFYNHTNNNHPAVIGRITDVINQGETIKFVFEGFQAIPQQLLNENITALGLARAALRNELDEEHWSIKREDLIQIISDLGITVI